MLAVSRWLNNAPRRSARRRNVRPVVLATRVAPGLVVGNLMLVELEEVEAPAGHERFRSHLKIVVGALLVTSSLQNDHLLRPCHFHRRISSIMAWIDMMMNGSTALF